MCRRVPPRPPRPAQPDYKRAPERPIARAPLLHICARPPNLVRRLMRARILWRWRPIWLADNSRVATLARPGPPASDRRGAHDTMRPQAGLGARHEARRRPIWLPVHKGDSRRAAPDKGGADALDLRRLSLWAPMVAWRARHLQNGPNGPILARAAWLVASKRANHVNI